MMSEVLGIDKQVQTLLAELGAEKSKEVLKHYNGNLSVVDMFSHFWSLDEAHSCLGKEIPQSTKSKSDSERLRKEGNKAYEKKKLKEALQLYNLSILAAPHPPPPLVKDSSKADHQILEGNTADKDDQGALPLAYANRSAVLFELKQFEDCLSDIQRAMDLGYPESLQHKLVKWREVGTAALHNPEIQKERLITRVSVKPPCLAEPNPALPALSNAVRLAFGPSVGRYLVAQREILPGEVLVVEDIFSKCLYNKYLQTHCSTCFTRCLVPLPCPNCATVVFCSDECRRQGLSGQHRLECSILPSLGVMNTCMIVSYRILTQIPFTRLKKLLAQFRFEKESGSPSAMGFNEEGIYDSADYRTVFCLVTNQEKRDSKGLFTICAGAFLLTKLLYQSRLYFVDEEGNALEPTREDFVDAGSTLFHHIMSDLSNGHRYGELQTSGQDGNPDTQNIGAWISPTLSLANHSCDQSVITCNKGNLGVMTAIQVIKPGQEVTTGYVRGYGVQNISLRKEILTTHYLFDCICRACKEDWPTFADLPDSYEMKCLNCPHVINRSDSKCSSCGLEYTMDGISTYNSKRIDQEVGLAILGFLRMRKDFKMDRLELKQEDLRLTVKVIDIMDRYVILPNKIYANAKIFLAGLLRNQRDYVKIKQGF